MKRFKGIKKDIRRNGILYVMLGRVVRCRWLEYSRIKILRKAHCKCCEYCWNKDFAFIFGRK